MSAVNITNVTVLDNPAPFLNPFQFEISYECLTPLKDDLEWKLVYVGSAEDETYDQLLESVLVGPVNVGNYRFVFEADPPDPSKIREEDIIGVTVLLLTCSYMGQEFVRVGYYVNNDYNDEQLREEPPQKVLVDRVQRNILADKPRVTKFPINFQPENNKHGEQPPPSPDHATGMNENGEEPSTLSNHPSDVRYLGQNVISKTQQGHWRVSLEAISAFPCCLFTFAVIEVQEGCGGNDVVGQRR
ncbi:unnamed protein product [Camellia sinensis]